MSRRHTVGIPELKAVIHFCFFLSSHVTTTAETRFQLPKVTVSKSVFLFCLTLNKHAIMSELSRPPDSYSKLSERGNY